jgi:hypothetical protein
VLADLATRAVMDVGSRGGARRQQAAYGDAMNRANQLNIDLNS